MSRIFEYLVQTCTDRLFGKKQISVLHFDYNRVFANELDCGHLK